MKKELKGVEKVVYEYKTKSPHGFIQSEIEDVLKLYPYLDKQKFEDALIGVTCMIDENNNHIIYHCDIVNALRCGIQKRDLTMDEWD